MRNMDREKYLHSPTLTNTYRDLTDLHKTLDNQFISELKRALPFNEELLDRWDRAKKLGFGEHSSIYDSSLVFCVINVGSHVWIGPFTIIDGSGGLTIGDHCTISAGVHIYTHDNVERTLTGGAADIIRASVEIGSNTYIGPHSVIKRGISIGHHVIIGSGSYVNKTVPPYSVIAGSPATVIGEVIVSQHHIRINYFKKDNDQAAF